MLKLLRCYLIKKTMRTIRIVVPSPGFDLLLSIMQDVELMFIETFVPELAVEAFDVGVFVVFLG